MTVYLCVAVRLCPVPHLPANRGAVDPFGAASARDGP